MPVTRSEPSDVVLRPLPPTFSATRHALHAVAEQIVAPARKPDNEISLRSTPRGFGTPVFVHDGVEQQVRVEGAELVHRQGDTETRTGLTSLADAGAVVAPLLPADTNLDRAALDIDREAALALGAWYAFGNALLEQLRHEAAAGDDPTPVCLWPEHFDIAIESGAEAPGSRGNYGLSPGDEHHPEPYLYVGPWRGDVSGELWNATGFKGAELGYADLLAAEDQLGVALDFCRARRKALDLI